MRFSLDLDQNGAKNGNIDKSGDKLVIGYLYFQACEKKIKKCRGQGCRQKSH